MEKVKRVYIWWNLGMYVVNAQIGLIYLSFYTPGVLIFICFFRFIIKKNISKSNINEPRLRVINHF